MVLCLTACMTTQIPPQLGTCSPYTLPLTISDLAKYCRIGRSGMAVNVHVHQVQGVVHVLINKLRLISTVHVELRR